MLPQWHVKDPGHSSKSAGVSLHLNKHTPLTQRSQNGLTMLLSRHCAETYRGNKLTCNSSRNTWSQSSQLVEPLWTDPGLKSGISMRALIYTLKKMKKMKQKCKQEMNGRTFSPNPGKRAKATIIQWFPDEIPS